MPTLLFENGPDRGSGVELEADRSYLLGRDPRCDIVVRDDLVSRHHARIKEFKGAWYIKDQGSTNGVLINDRRSKQAAINYGDQIRLGNAVLTLLEESLEQVRREKTLGGYRLRQRLGRGGMGTVYKALQVSLGREVALKVLSPHLVKDRTFVQQFLREARAAGQLNHPHIVQVYDVGQDGETFYYSMEFIDGGSLEDLLQKEGSIDVDETIHILQQAALALEYAESRHIIHRDIKPDNLMLTSDGVLKIADLGLALSMKESSDANDQPILGTPHFISPEQALRRDVDIRSDIYSLGATAYRMLTGRTVFEGKSAEDIIRKAVREDPVPIKEAEPAVPEKLAAIIDRMLEKDPEDRFDTAQHLREELETLTRKRSRTAVLVGVSGLAAAALGLALYFAFRPPETEKVVEIQEDTQSKKDAFEAMSQLDKKKFEVEALRAYIAILNDNPTREERLEDLYAWIDEYGTLPIDESRVIADEAAAITGEIEEERVAAARAAEARATRLANIQRRSEAEIAAGEYAASLRVAAELDPDAETSEDHKSEVQDLRERLERNAMDAARKLFAQLQSEVSEPAEAQDYELALECCVRAGESFPLPPDDLDDEFLVELTRFHEFFLEEHRSIELARTSAQQDLQNLQHARVLACFGGELREELLRLDFSAARERFQSAADELSLESYRQIVLPHLADLQQGADLVQRLHQRLADDNDPPTITYEGERARLESFDEPSGIFRVRISHGDLGSSSKEVPIAHFATPSGVRTLFERSLQLAAEDKSALIGLMVLIQSARRVEQLAPVAAQISQYDPNEGWSDRMRVPWEKLSGPGLRAVADPLIAELANQGSQDASGLEALVQREADAMASLTAAISPFVHTPQRVSWVEAAQRMRSLFTDHQQTTLMRMAYPLLHRGSRYPLVEQ